MAPAAERDLRKLDPHVRKRVIQDILLLELSPRPHGAGMLEAKGRLWRLYVGPGKNYRAVYQIRDEVLVVLLVKVGDRKDVYRRLK